MEKPKKPQGLMEAFIVQNSQELRALAAAGDIVGMREVFIKRWGDHGPHKVFRRKLLALLDIDYDALRRAPVPYGGFMFTQQALFERGWTRGLIQRLLGPCDKTYLKKHFGRNINVLLFDVERVLNSETLTPFQLRLFDNPRLLSTREALNAQLLAKSHAPVVELVDTQG